MNRSCSSLGPLTRTTAMFLIPVLLIVLSAESAVADEAAPSESSGMSYALIVAGLPGDSERDAQYSGIVAAWRQWLSDSAGFPADQIQVLGRDERPSRIENVEAAVTDLSGRLTKNDRLWVFTLGHGDVQDGRARLHIPGPDIDQVAFAALFDHVDCREQVFWMTHDGSHGFLSELSRHGRIVISATSHVQEANETEFPVAMSEVLKQPLDELDADGDGSVSIRELFLAIEAQVRMRFDQEQLAPTEHSVLDDDGNREGTQAQKLVQSKPEVDTPAISVTDTQPRDPASGNEPPTAGNGASRVDGKLAAQTGIPIKN